MGKRRTKSRADEVERLLRAIRPRHRQIAVRRALDGYFSDGSRHDGRGRKAAELEKVKTTLRHIVGMPGWVEDIRYDLNFRRRIRDLLRHIAHGQPWATTVVECSTARGLANRAGQAWNEGKEYGPGEPIDLVAGHTDHPLNTIAKMRRGGRRGGNCLRDNEYGHHDQLRDRESEYHEIRNSGVGVAWLRVECESREIAEIHGPGNDEDVDLPVDVLWALCRKLGVSGDYEDLFLRSGVLSIFLEGKVDRDDPMRTVRGYRFWWRPREIVVHDSRRDRWSRFVWRRRAWRAAGPSDLDGDTFRVMRELVPAIRGLALRARPTRARRPRRPRT